MKTNRLYVQFDNDIGNMKFVLPCVKWNNQLNWIDLKIMNASFSILIWSFPASMHGWSDRAEDLCDGAVHNFHYAQAFWSRSKPMCARLLTSWPDLACPPGISVVTIKPSQLLICTCCWGGKILHARLTWNKSQMSHAELVQNSKWRKLSRESKN